MDPIEALERIAFALERSLAPTFRVQAFRRAAAALRALSPEELRSRATTGRLRQVPGVGETTERVVIEALAGNVPAYLREVEEGAVAPELEGPAATLLAALRGDCHSHSDWSDGGSSIEEMAVTARGLGHEYLVLTDHSPRLTVAHGLSPERLREQLKVVAEINDRLAPFRILTGIEVDILLDGQLDQEDELLAGLDIVVASVHSKLRMESPEMTKRMVAAVRNPHVDILGHCTGRKLPGLPARRRSRQEAVKGAGRPESTFDAEAVFTACLETGTAVEVNCRPERLDPPRRLLRMAIELGCHLSIDTDAHAPGQLSWQANGATRAAECGARVESVVNTWPAETLLAWTASHAA